MGSILIKSISEFNYSQNLVSGFSYRQMNWYSDNFIDFPNCVHTVDTIELEPLQASYYPLKIKPVLTFTLLKQ